MPQTQNRLAFLFLSLLFLSSSLAADTFTGKVVRVLDGDTVEVLDIDTNAHRIRLAGIDAPEAGQDFGTKAKRQLIELAARKVVEVEFHKRDKYHRILGKLIADQQDVNLAMVRDGFAWWYRKYAGEQLPADRALYETAEKNARSERRGLWVDSSPMAPWDWRHRPEPDRGYATVCPCESGQICTGNRGGRFCVRSTGTTRYLPRDNAVGSAEIISSPITEIVLPPLSSTESARLRELEDTGPLRFGIGRDVPEGQAAVDTTRQAFSLRLRSSGAVGIRLALRVSHLPDDVILRLSGSGAEVQTIPGSTVNAGVREDADIYWFPLIVGDALSLDVELPAGADQVAISLAKVSHFFRLPAAYADNLACPEGWDLPSLATAMLLHTNPAGDSGVCTGTLLADTDQSTYIPYLLTAHHCIPDQATASSLGTYWFPCGQDRATVSGGADLLYASKTTDTSFLRLRRPPPAGTVFADWSPTLPQQGTPVTGIHHPLGGPRQIAFGELLEYIGCEVIDYCGDHRGREDLHYLRVTWATGATAAGSSGSGLFLPTGQLVGTLSGGVDNRDDYGRFDIPYREALHQWLGPSAAWTSLGPSPR